MGEEGDKRWAEMNSNEEETGKITPFGTKTFSVVLINRSHPCASRHHDYVFQMKVGKSVSGKKWTFSIVSSVWSFLSHLSLPSSLSSLDHEKGNEGQRERALALTWVTRWVTRSERKKKREMLSLSWWGNGRKRTSTSSSRPLLVDERRRAEEMLAFLPGVELMIHDLFLFLRHRLDIVVHEHSRRRRMNTLDVPTLLSSLLWMLFPLLVNLYSFLSCH